MTVPNEILIEEVAALIVEGRDVELMCRGTSMLPFIVGDRDSVILTKADGVLLPGDIVLARSGHGSYVLHRVVAVCGDEVTMRGDGNISMEEHVRKDDILGRVTGIVKPGGMVRPPGRARLWRFFGPFTRRCVLAFYRRTIYKIIR